MLFYLLVLEMFTCVTRNAEEDCNFSDNYIDMSVNYVDMSDSYIDMS